MVTLVYEARGYIFPWASFLASIGNPIRSQTLPFCHRHRTCVTDAIYTFTGVLLLLESQGLISLDLHGFSQDDGCLTVS